MAAQKPMYLLSQWNKYFKPANNIPPFHKHYLLKIKLQSMKRLFVLLAVCLALSAGFSSCKNCKQCHAEMLGVKSPPQEYCGEQLEQVRKVTGMVCE